MRFEQFLQNIDTTSAGDFAGYSESEMRQVSDKLLNIMFQAEGFSPEITLSQIIKSGLLEDDRFIMFFSIMGIAAMKEVFTVDQIKEMANEFFSEE